MLRTTRTIASIVVSLALVGCAEFLGINGDTVDVEVIAEARQINNIIGLIGYTVENRSSDTVYFSSAWLERRDGDEWRDLSVGVPRIDILLAIPIAPGEDFTTESLLNHLHGPPVQELPIEELELLPGEYRYRVSMFEDNDLERRLTRTSNTVRID